MFSDYEELSKYDTPGGGSLGESTDANGHLQCSISHQLLPEAERTKPEDVSGRTRTFWMLRKKWSF